MNAATPPGDTRPAPRARRRRRRGSRRGKTTWQKVALYWTGWAFIVLGALGLFLPILQGVLFLLVGLFLLSSVSPRIRLLRQRLRSRARARYPEWTAKFEDAEGRAKHWVRRIVRSRRA
ncbi:MAG TPA: hypothetical protein VMV26_08950 [Alphaproteobacteria bacterium]|nr:hypothetical protein [Alphaproteobacteria bacterium]